MVQTKLLEAVTTMSTSFDDIKLMISKVDSRLSSRLADLEEAMRTIAASTRPGSAQPALSSVKTELGGIWDAEKPMAVILDDDISDILPGFPVPAVKPAIPENHTTGTGNLLMWPPIQNLVGPLFAEHGIEYPKTYPLSIEENRGLLHLYGRGEGSKSGSEVPNDFGLLASAYPKDVAPSPSSNNDLGGMDTMETAPCLRFDHEQMWKLVGSYKENMQNMHPIILPRDLDALISKFLQSLSTVYLTKSARPAPIAGFAAKHEIVGEKRKREDTDDSSGPKVVHQKRPALSRDIETAVVLCILALGEICLHKERIPDIVRTHGEMQGQGSFSSQPYPFQGFSASRNGVPPFPVQGTPLSVGWHPTRSRRASFFGSTSEPMKRNIDVIPGLQYLANATDIMGNQMGGTSVWHVHASILAGLYYGQLGRVMESYWHIHHACIKAQHFFRDDIIAELNLQQSGISKYEQSMPTPNLGHMIECGIDQRVAYSYHAQIWLRKTLNNEGLDPTDPLNGPLDPKDKTVLEIAKRGINALIYSTKAFHSLSERRYIVTNIFGTAQAQWGNLITLAAVYRCRHLSHFVDFEELKSLFDKTIQFLEVVSHRSNAFEVNKKTLAGLRDSLFLTSFSQPETLPTISQNPPHNSMSQSVFHPCR
ncbi:hypothetical protein MCOR04_008880 [Pyricularia oryzae]|nr:hypothetical protein MCOR04_008880 [Pyricularia oryzae]